MFFSLLPSFTFRWPHLIVVFFYLFWVSIVAHPNKTQVISGYPGLPKLLLEQIWQRTYLIAIIMRLKRTFPEPQGVLYFLCKVIWTQDSVWWTECDFSPDLFPRHRASSPAVTEDFHTSLTHAHLHSLLVLFIHPNYFSGCPPRMCLDDVDLLCEIIMLKVIHPITLKPSSLSHFKHTHDPHCSILYMCVALFKRPTTFWSLVDSAPHLF